MALSGRCRLFFSGAFFVIRFDVFPISAQIDGVKALVGRLNLVFHGLARLQALVALHLDIGVVDEQILPTFIGPDKPVPLGIC